MSDAEWDLGLPAALSMYLAGDAIGEMSLSTDSGTARQRFPAPDQRPHELFRFQIHGFRRRIAWHRVEISESDPGTAHGGKALRAQQLHSRCKAAR